MRVRKRLNTYFVVQQSVSFVPTLTKVFPVARVAFCVRSETRGRTVDLVQLIVAAAALSAAVSHLPNKFVNIRFVSMCPPRTGPAGSLNNDVRGDPPWARNVWVGLYPDVTRCAGLLTHPALARYTFTRPPLPGRIRFYERKEDLIRFWLPD